MPTNPYAAPKSLRSANPARRLVGYCLIAMSVVLACVIQLVRVIRDFDMVMTHADNVVITRMSTPKFRIDWWIVGPLLVVAFVGLLLVIASRKKMS